MLCITEKALHIYMASTMLLLLPVAQN